MRVASNDLADWERKEEEAAAREERERIAKEAKAQADKEARAKRLAELDVQIRNAIAAKKDLETEKIAAKAQDIADGASAKAVADGNKSSGGGSSGGGGASGGSETGGVVAKRKGVAAKPFPAEYLEPLKRILLEKPTLGVDKVR